jgi:hypothetical protein
MARSTTHHFSVSSLMSPFFSDPLQVTRGDGGNVVTSVAGPWRAGLPSRGMGTVGRRRGGGGGGGAPVAPA